MVVGHYDSIASQDLFHTQQRRFVVPMDCFRPVNQQDPDPLRFFTCDSYTLGSHTCKTDVTSGGGRNRDNFFFKCRGLGPEKSFTPAYWAHYRFVVDEGKEELTLMKEPRHEDIVNRDKIL